MEHKRCCRIKCDPGEYVFADSHDPGPHEHCWRYWIIIPALIIGLPCLLVGLNEKAVIDDNNNYINDVYILTNISADTKIDTTFKLQQGTNCFPVDNTTDISKLSKCNSIDQITQEQYCTADGDCIEKICNPCKYKCYTDQCWIKEEQHDCITDMSKYQCTITYNSRTTYLCLKDPNDTISECQRECPDFSCKTVAENYKCLKYATNLCNIMKVPIVTTVLYIHYNVDGIKYSANITCDNKDQNCLVKLNDTAANIKYIYYNKLNPNDTEINIDDLLESTTTRIDGLIISGAVFTTIGCLVMLTELFYFISMIKCIVNCRDLEQYNVRPNNNGGEIPTCSICLQNYREKTGSKQIACGHVFHESCINECQRLGQSCPLCRREIKEMN
jgi:hypothetical protein